MVLTVAERIGPAQRTAAAGQYNNFSGKAVAIVDIAFSVTTPVFTSAPFQPTMLSGQTKAYPSTTGPQAGLP